jgi:hypothetical protein
MRSPARLFAGVVGLACAGLLAACQGDLVQAVSPPLHPSFAVGGGNSGAAHLCQNGGYLTLLPASGTAFTNTGDCVSYAAHGGQFFQRITFSNISLGACNDITFGYTVNGVSTDVYNKPYDCAPFHTYADVSILVPVGSTVDVYLRDNTCGVTFTQESGHALVTGTNPYQIAITDAGGFCEATSTTASRPPTNGVGNLNVTETIS